MSFKKLESLINKYCNYSIKNIMNDDNLEDIPIDAKIKQAVTKRLYVLIYQRKVLSYYKNFSDFENKLVYTITKKILIELNDLH